MPGEKLQKIIACLVFDLVRLFAFPFVLLVLAKELFALDWSNKYWYLVLSVYVVGILTKENKQND